MCGKFEHSKGFISLMAYLDMERLVEKAIKLTDTQIDQMIDWQILEEERLEAKILIWLDTQQQASLKSFDEKFTPMYEDKEKSQKAVSFLSNVSLEPRRKYKQVGIYRFFKNTIPTQCKEWFQKDDLGNLVELVSYINSLPFQELMDDSTFRAYYSGGQSSFTILNIPISFQLLDKDAERRLKEYILQLSTQVSAQVSSSIQLELLEGIRNFESIPQLRARILSVWDKPIQVNVPPKLVDGKVVRVGYSYNLSAEQWATTVARTEVTRAFQLGRIDAYRQTGIVKKVSHAVTPDERLCNICAPMEGNIYELDEAQLIFPVHASCLTDPQSPIYTSKGWKRIIDIKKGDLVLSHKGKMRKVLELHRNKVGKKYVKIHINGTTLSFTPDHPVFVGGIWIHAKKVKSGDSMQILAKKCDGDCIELVPYNKQFCSKRCKAKLEWKSGSKDGIAEKNRIYMEYVYKEGLRVGSEIIKSAHKAVRKQFENGTLWNQLDSSAISGDNNIMRKSAKLRKESSERLLKKNPMHDPKIREKATNSLKKFWREHPEKHPNHIVNKKGHTTDIEKIMMKGLKKIGLKYVFNKHVGRYWPDFQLKNHKIIIECDGEYWHKDKVYEKKRDKYLEELGYIVLHFTGTDIKNNIKLCIDEIIRIIDNHNDNYLFTGVIVKKVEHKNAKWDIYTYNLSIDKDETFLYKGVIVHNCRCTPIPIVDYKGTEKLSDVMTGNVTSTYIEAGFIVQ